MNAGKYEEQYKAEYEAKIRQKIADNPRYTATLRCSGILQRTIPSEEFYQVNGQNDFSLTRAFLEAEPLLDWFALALSSGTFKPTRFIVFDALRDQAQGSVYKNSVLDRAGLQAWMNEATIESAALDLFRRDVRQSDIEAEAAGNPVREPSAEIPSLLR